MYDDGTFNYYSADHDDIQVSVNGSNAVMIGKSKVIAALYFCLYKTQNSLIIEVLRL